MRSLDPHKTIRQLSPRAAGQINAIQVKHSMAVLVLLKVLLGSKIQDEIHLMNLIGGPTGPTTDNEQLLQILQVSEVSHAPCSSYLPQE